MAKKSNAEKGIPTPESGGPETGNLPSPATDGLEAKRLRVSAKREGFRRAGRAWSMTPVFVDAAGFSADQIEALLDEPMLDVEFVAEET